MTVYELIKELTEFEPNEEVKIEVTVDGIEVDGEIKAINESFKVDIEGVYVNKRIGYRGSDVCIRVYLGGLDMNNKEKHKAMWTWLAENPTKSKREYFKEHSIDEVDMPPCMCYACAEADYRKSMDASYDPRYHSRCKYCPIKDWGGTYKCFIINSYYDLYQTAEEYCKHEEAAGYARLIAEAEWKEVE